MTSTERAVTRRRTLPERLQHGEPDELPPLIASDRNAAPLSFAQEQIWLHEQRSGSGPYNLASLHDVLGPLDEEALSGALGDVVERHDALRTRYSVSDGVACNAIGPSSFVLERADVRAAATQARERAQAWCVALCRRPYDLENGMPFRAGLVRYAGDAALLVLAFHHLAYDYASGATIFADLENAYRARRMGSRLAERAELGYLDCAAWQRAALTPQALARQRLFWNERFASEPPLVVLPGDAAAYDSEPVAGASVTSRLTPAIANGLRVLADAEGASLFTGLLTAFRTLVQRYTGLDDVSIGVPVAGRSLPAMRGVVGCFVNTLPVRTVVEANASFREALRAMRDATDAAYDAQDYPYAWIVRDAAEIRPRRPGGLLQLSATMRDRHRATLHLEGTRTRELPIELGFAKFDCGLVISESMDELTCTFIYREARSPAAYMAAFARAFEMLVESAVAEPDRACATLLLVHPQERRQLSEWASGARGVEPATLEQIVRARAHATPDAPAILDRAETCSYAQLVRHADAVAQALRNAGVEPGMRIGVCSERSAALIAAILGIGFARATYVPLDPALPPARLAALARDAHVRYTLASAAQAGRFLRDETFVLETFGQNAGARPSTASSSAYGARADDVAYVIYTSGSTGTPKGIAVPHRALANLGYATSETLGLVGADRCLFRASIAFDASLSEIAAPLCAGAAIVIAPNDQSADPRALVETAIAQRVSVLGVVPSLLAALLAEPRFATCSLRIVTSGGEVLGASLVQRFFAVSDAALYNLYGPSEAAGHVTMHACSREERLLPSDGAPLGRPIQSATVSVRDPSLGPVPPGAIGEIVIGGRPLALGYVGRAADDRRSFVPDPHSGGSPVYRTGDLARLRPDGTLAFLGRADAQVKIRGVRIEPSDVATALEGIDGIRRAHVFARPRSPDAEAHDLILVAYVVAQERSFLDAAGVRRALADLLPSSMLPAQIRFVDALPLTANGKVDAAALRARTLDAPYEERARRPGREPQSPQERRIATLWETLLGRTQLAVDDDFFTVGGDSLLAMRLIARLEEAFGRRIAPARFFAEPTIAALAHNVNDTVAHVQRDVERFHERGSKTPFVFLHGDFAGGRYAWRLAALLGIDQPVTIVGPNGRDGRSAACDVEHMADDLCERLAELYPTGPLRLGGFSMAGHVALEAARKLAARGRTIDDVIVIGTGAGNVRFRTLERIARRVRLPAEQRRTLIRRVRRIVIYVAAFRRGDAAWRLARVRSILRLSGRPSHAPRAAWQDIDIAGFRRYVGAHDAFVPRPYAGRVFLIWPRDQHSRASDPQDDWRSLGCDLTVASMPGDHDAAVTTHLEDMARLVAQRLDTTHDRRLRATSSWP